MELIERQRMVADAILLERAERALQRRGLGSGQVSGVRAELSRMAATLRRNAEEAPGATRET